MLRKYPGAGRLLIPAESLKGVGLEFMLGRSCALVNAFLPCFSQFSMTFGQRTLFIYFLPR